MKFLGIVLAALLIYILIVTGVVGTILEAILSGVLALLGIIGSAIGSLLANIFSGIGSAIGSLFKNLFSGLGTGILNLLKIIAIPAGIILGIALIIRMVRFTFFTCYRDSSPCYSGHYYDNSSNALYIGNRRSKVVHRADDDDAETISFNNRVYFDSLSDALDHGYREKRSA